MRFKIVRLLAIRNGSKQTISASGRLELLQMVSEQDTGWCASEDAGPYGGWIEGNVLYKGVETSP